MLRTDPPLFYTEDEVGELLRVHPTTIARKVQAGTFPIEPLRIGNRRVYSVLAVHQLAGLPT